jgi:hypothetical protein
MGVKKGDLIDERKRHAEGCGLIVKIMDGGEGFEKIVCCGHELTEEDIVQRIANTIGRKKGTLSPGTVLDERLVFAHCCGLRVMILDGGAGFQEIRCCGHAISVSAVRELRMGQFRGPLVGGPEGPQGTA